MILVHKALILEPALSLPPGPSFLLSRICIFSSRASFNTSATCIIYHDLSFLKKINRRKSTCKFTKMPFFNYKNFSFLCIHLFKTGVYWSQTITCCLNKVMTRGSKFTIIIYSYPITISATLCWCLKAQNNIRDRNNMLGIVLLRLLVNHII